MADPRRRARALALTLVGAGASLLAVGQPWSVQQGVDPAGVAVQESWTGQDLAPGVAALVLLVVVTSVVGLVWRGTAGLLARSAAVVTALVATVMVLGVRPDAPTAWWWIALGGAVLAGLGAVLALRPRAGGARGHGATTGPEVLADPVPAPADPHERARRSQDAAWSALSAGEDPTLGPRPAPGPGAGTMSDEGQVDPSGR
ncbi:hypothetical protein [Serinicoccus profundi]|uniref:hypothetical protein n=1 Tax=Serinicoccus profundi TaxID=1078471 RepID=UPI000255E8F9|nr:hypothetical protein [Serinicoccus profundi]